MLGAWAHQPVRSRLNPGGAGGVVAAVAGAQGAGADGLLLGLEPRPVRGRLGVVGGVAEGRWAGRASGGEGARVRAERCRAARGVSMSSAVGCAVAAEGDAGAIEELDQCQPAGAIEALGVGGGCFAGCDVPVWCQGVGVSDGRSGRGVVAGRVLSKSEVSAVGWFL